MRAWRFKKSGSKFFTSKTIKPFDVAFVTSGSGRHKWICWASQVKCLWKFGEIFRWNIRWVYEDGVTYIFLSDNGSWDAQALKVKQSTRPEQIQQSLNMKNRFSPLLNTMSYSPKLNVFHVSLIKAWETHRTAHHTPNKDVSLARHGLQGRKIGKNSAHKRCCT